MMKINFGAIWPAILWWFRPIIKWILRRTTRLCELQRICYGEYKGASRTCKVEFSLDSTRNLDLQKIMKLLDLKAKDTTLTKDVIYYGVYTVVKVKNINIKVHKRFPEMLTESMIKIWGYRQLMASLEAVRSTKYDSTNSEHEDKLLELWSLLRPNVKLENRVSKQWQNIGFQGEDPKTDFRGMGMLGLENLKFFAENHQSAAQHVLMRSQHPTFGYSFAIVGINITHLAFSLVEDGEAKSHFFNSCKEFPDLHSFHQFFSYLFYEFDVLWRHEKPKDIMEFSRVRNKFETSVKNCLKDPNARFKCRFVLENV